MKKYTIVKVEGSEHLYEVFLADVWQAKIRVEESAFYIIRGYLPSEGKEFVHRRFWPPSL
jgi:hypothetical protein